MFNIHRFISKSDPGFFPCCLETLLKFFRVLCHTHSLSATTECCLDNNRITDFFCDLCPFLHIINCLFTPRNDRDSCFYHGIPCLRFISEPADHVRWWSDIDNITLFTEFRKTTVFGKESKSRMDCIRTGYQRRTDDVLHIQITVCGRCRTYTYCFIRKLCMQSIPVCL